MGAVRKLGVVRYQHQGGPELAVQLKEQRDDAFPGGGIQIARRLVGKQNARLVHKGAGDRHALLLSTGKLRRKVPPPVRQSDAPEKVTRPLPRPGIASKIERNRDVFFGRKGRNQLKRLKNETDGFTPQPRALVFRQGADVGAIQQHPARRWPIQTGEQAQQGAFSAPRWPDNRDQLAVADHKRDAVQHGERRFAAPVRLFKLLNHQHMMRSVVWLWLLANLAACGQREPEGSAPPPPSGQVTEQNTPVVLFLGTSLTAGLGVEPEQAFPALLQERIDSAGLAFEVVNAGVSGETSASALSRIDWLLRQPFDVLVLETGANDMLRGANLNSLESNLQAIIDKVRAARPQARIVLVGMMAPPNLGAEYGRRFREIYPEVARRNNLPLVPFLLEGVGGVAALNQADAIHPNEAGHEKLAETVWEELEPVLQEADN